MTTANLIDLASLPVPDVLEILDFETIYAERKAALVRSARRLSTT